MAKGAPPEGQEHNGVQQPVPGSPQHLNRHQQSANVTLLDGTNATFIVDRNAEGKALFNQVVAHLNLTEKDYFALSFRDDGNRNWLYNEKRIAKQLHGRPWDFHFEVKFYPPEPSTLSDDLTRYLLTLQVRRDIYTGKLPASFATHALLGSFVAQAELGDYEQANDATYAEYLNNVQLAPVATSELFDKIKELHKTHKGQTPAEAELHYLENAKKLTMYGVDLFPAKDAKGTPVTLGVCAHGIMVYRDQIRVNRFAWPKIIKIAYRRNTFSVKLRPGELEKNETTVVFKLTDYHAAKRVWKTAVEHHTFFRLVQPEEKAKKGLFRFGSARFRYNGRTQFQSKMASQMNVDRPAPIVQRSQSARFASRSTEQIGPISKGPREHTSPLHYVDDGHGGSRDKLSSPEKSYAVQHDALVKSTPGKEKDKDTKDKKKKKTKVKGAKDKSGKEKDGATSSSSSSSSSDDSDNDASGKKSKKKKQHKLKKVAAPVVANGADSREKTADVGETVALQHVEHDAEPKQDYEPAAASDGKLVKTVRTTEVYRISGSGEPPQVDPNDTSLQRTLDLSKASNGQTPTVELVERNTTVAYASDKAVPEEKEFLLTEGSGPHTTVRSWQETAEGPETVTTETDEHGNIITRTVKSHQVKQTIQRQTYQTYQVPIDENSDVQQQTTTVTRQLYSPAHGQPVSVPVGEDGVPLVESHSRTIAYEAATGSDPSRVPENVPGEFVSSRTVTSGNRTVETITYKTEKDGVIETHVEHRVTIHSGGEIDHDAELSAAIMEATNMNPDMTVEKIEVKQESQC